MPRELMWLTCTVILTGLMWVPYILDRIMVRGLMGAMANPSRHDKPQSAWAQRLYFAHTNAVENLVIFAALVLILDAHRHSTRKHRDCLRGLFLGAARSRHRLYDGRSGVAHARFRGRLRGAGGAGAGDLRKAVALIAAPRARRSPRISMPRGSSAESAAIVARPAARRKTRPPPPAARA